MRRIERATLPVVAQRYLDGRQSRLDADVAAGHADVERSWKDARKTKSVGGDERSVLSTLRQMSGTRHRCMYCLDSHGCDIEHFRPKAVYPERAFRWSNLLLCCTECGRFKGDRFPVSGADPLLIDPSAEDPWVYLDFDPDTGNIGPRFDVASGDWSVKGRRTVDTLRLDRREALSQGHLVTFRRLAEVVHQELARQPAPLLESLLRDLRAADDHGLLPWCFGPAGRAVEPFQSLCSRFPDLWAQCAAHSA